MSYESELTSKEINSDYEKLKQEEKIQQQQQKNQRQKAKHEQKLQTEKQLHQETLEGKKLLTQWEQDQDPSKYQDRIERQIPTEQHILNLEEKLQDKEEEKKEVKEKYRQTRKETKKQEALLPIWEKIIGLKIVNTFLEYQLKIGLAPVPILSLFSIAGVTTILNPFVNPDHTLVILFMIFSAICLVWLTSIWIIRQVYIQTEKELETKFWGLTNRSWRVIHWINIWVFETLIGFATIPHLIDSARMAANEASLNSNLPMLGGWDKFHLMLGVAIFAAINIYGSVAKGNYIRFIEQRNSTYQAQKSDLDFYTKELQSLDLEIEVIKTQIENLKAQIIYPVPLEENYQKIMSMSNENTMGADTKGKHPGTYSNNNSSAKNSSQPQDLSDFNLTTNHTQVGEKNGKYSAV